MAEDWCAYLVLCRDAAEPLADAHQCGNPLRRVPPTGALVSTHLADPDRSRPETGLLGGTVEELLRNPLALAVAHADGIVGRCVDRLDSRSGICVICGRAS